SAWLRPSQDLGSKRVSRGAGDGFNAEAERTPLGAWWMLAVLLLFYVLSINDRLILSMLVAPMKADLHLSDVQVGLIMGPAFAICYALAGVPLGWASDRFPRRWVIFLGVSAWSLFAAGSGVARTFLSLFLCRVGVGIGEAALTPAAYSLMADKFPRRRLTLAMSIYQMGSMVGSAGAFALGGMIIGFATALGPIDLPLLHELKPWHLVLILTGAPGVIVAGLAFTFSEPARRGADVLKPKSHRSLFAFALAEWRLLLPMALGFSLVVMCANTMVAWVPTFMTRQFGWSPVQYGPALGAVSIVASSTMIVKGWLVDLLYARGVRDAHLRFYTWILGISIPLALGLFWIPQPMLFLIAYAALQAIAMQFVVYVAATVQLVTPLDLRGQVIAAFVSLFSVVGLGLGPLLTAMLTDYLFRDEAKLGASLALVTGVAIPLAFIFLRIALRPVHAAMAREATIVADPAVA
ncbi:MAG: hypothetical protein JWO33_1577, partial [Caulobacteraceae bacterium]|nr:hypothetical protein [Caulobacteraceae bacterium]